MPITLPTIDDRRYQDLLDEALARVPVHTPEWTNFNKSDPGVTVVELFAFLTESLLYRANQIPERNRLRFLQLLNVPLQPASAAQGLATIANEKGPLQAVALGDDLELRAGAVPFRTEQGLAVLPVEAAVYFKREVVKPSQDLQDYYALLYASYNQEMPTDFSLYETVQLDGRTVSAVSLGASESDTTVARTLDRSLWIALLARKNDKPDGNADDPWQKVRAALGGQVLTLGLVPATDASGIDLQAAAATSGNVPTLLSFEIPRTAANGTSPTDAGGQPVRQYQSLDARADVDVLSVPGTVQITLPSAEQIDTWRDLDPLESGVGDLPPNIDDDAVAGRVITWLRVRCTAAAQAKFQWLGINTVAIKQCARVGSEPLADGSGQPDQMRQLAHAPVLPDSVSIASVENGKIRAWQPIDDLLAAGPEVAVRDPRLPPGCTQATLNPVDVFALDAEAGRIRFGDGLRGRRPGDGVKLYASYDWSQGSAGNLSAGAINSSPALPAGFTVTNAVPTWGGADAESVTEGEKQVRRYLQHRDRLVTAADFEAIAYRTPGLDIGRVEVLPAFHPDLNSNQPGDAAGVVTLMVIPANDPDAPDAPEPDRIFLNTLCDYLDPRRLVTTELVLRGPNYRGIWISVGIDVVAGFSIADVIDAVKQKLKDFLAPVHQSGLADSTALLTAPQQAAVDRGWPLSTPVSARVLLAETARVAGVASVADVLLAEGDGGAKDGIDMKGLDLPRILGLSVVVGDPLPLDSLRGTGTGSAGDGTTASGKRILPVPVVPESC
jgi:hypothetical protein